MPLRGVIFDFDGTIADTLPLCVEAFRRAAEPLSGRRLSDEEIMATFGPSEEGSVRRLVPDAPEACLEAYLAHYETLHAEIRHPFDGIRELLLDLEGRGILRALVTGKGPRSAAISLRALGLEQAFDPVEAGWEHGVRKAEAIRDVLQSWGVEPHEVVYVGDAPVDVRASREAGIPVVGVSFGRLSHAAQLAAALPDALFFSVRELRRWLLSPA